MKRRISLAIAILCGLGLALLAGALLEAQTPVTFSPAPGTYAGPQTVHLSAPAGYTIFYTLNGYTATPASTKYSFPINIGTNTTISAIAVIAQAVNQDVGQASSGWKICTPDGGTDTGSPASNACKGVAGQPAKWGWNFGEIMTETMTSPPAGNAQILYIFTGPSADASTGMSQHKVVTATVSDACIENNEMDMQMVDSTHTRVTSCGSPSKVQTCQIENNGGLQCNQSGTNKGHWQIAGNSGWVTTSITDHCSPDGWVAGTPIDVTYQIHWDYNDTSCGGLPCDHYDDLTIDGVVHSLAAYSPIGARAVLSGHYLGNQDQLDNLTNCAAGRLISQNNVTGYTYSASQQAYSGAYVITTATPAFPGFLRAAR